jgi:hypothetical protein
MKPIFHITPVSVHVYLLYGLALDAIIGVQALYINTLAYNCRLDVPIDRASVILNSYQIYIK